MKPPAWLTAVRERIATQGRPATSDGLGNASLLLGREEEAYQAIDTALGALRGALSTSSAERTSLDRLDQDLRLLGARGRELLPALDLARDALERCRLLALNAGLEGARLGEAAGRALLALSDEVRTMAARGLEVLNDHSAALAQQTRAHEKLLSELELTARQNASVLDELARAEQSQLEAQRALAELAVELQRGLGSDPEVARVASASATHLTAVAAALGDLRSREQRQAAIEALRPSLQPLLRWLDEQARPSERT